MSGARRVALALALAGSAFHELPASAEPSTITVGPSVGHAFVETFYLEKAARAQFLALSSGAAIQHPPPGVAELTARQWQADFERNTGPREWPHLIRRLDRIDPGWRD